jgi:hypothetical protein
LSSSIGQTVCVLLGHSPKQANNQKKKKRAKKNVGEEKSEKGQKHARTSNPFLSLRRELRPLFRGFAFVSLSHLLSN